MSLSLYQHGFAHCLRRASERLGGPVCALVLEWELEQLLRRRLVSEDLQGLADGQLLVEIGGGRKGRELSVGIEVFRLRTPARDIRLAHVVPPYCRAACLPPDFWTVGRSDYDPFYRYVRRLARRAARQAPPIMHEHDRQRLWHNTVGFLLARSAAFRRFRIPKKRGVLLLGNPGNGKTMACRWLFAECRRRGLAWRHVTAGMYQEARDENTISSLFLLDRRGIVLFDDLDLGVRDRRADGPSVDHSALLGELDGVASRRGVVYLFTSNARLSDLDPAFRRPGRIDLVLEFARPDAALRARFVREQWPAEAQDHVDLDELVATTDGLSFAELEELRKLLVFHFLEHQQWDWPRAWQAFREGRGDARRSPRIGFERPRVEPLAAGHGAAWGASIER